jgi:hypothetical protein
MNDLSKFFGPQISFIILNNLLSITLSAFQLFTTFLLIDLKLNESLNYLEMLAISSGFVVLVGYDTVFHLRLCISCMNEVSLF